MMQSHQVIDDSFKKVLNLQLAIENNLEIMEGLLAELGDALNLFNEIYGTNPELFNKFHLKNAYHLSQLIGTSGLPSVSEFLFHLQTREDLKGLVLEEFNKFEFLDEITDERQLIGCSLVGFYRTFYLQFYPEFREKSAQIASTIEEMLAQMAIQGNKTSLFYAVKHWILDYKVEDFSEKLAEAVKQID